MSEKGQVIPRMAPYPTNVMTPYTRCGRVSLLCLYSEESEFFGSGALLALTFNFWILPIRLISLSSAAVPGTGGVGPLR